MHRKRTSLLLILAIFLVAGCSNGCTQAGNVAKTFKDMTPKEKSTYFMAFYNKQFTDTMTLANQPALSEDQKKLVRTKKSILEKMYPTIMAYDSVAVAGGIPSAETEAAINGLVEQLIQAGVK